MNFDKKIVIDTGTLLSASFRIGSVPSQAYLKALREFTVCVSEATLAELENVIQRDKFDKYLDLNGRLAFLELYRKNSVLHPVTETVFDCRDSKDNMFLELALSINADVIVSSDPDLQVLHPYRNISILKPIEFLNLHR
jgi:putative PIN family toxin of toxin-antitoxin system